MDDGSEALARPQPARPLGQRVHEWLVWFGIGRLAVVAASVLAIGLGGYWLLRPPPVPVESSLPRATTTTANGSAPGSAAPTVTEPATTVLAAGPLVVHVAGHVVSPGVYALPPGSRVVDAVAAAGGPDDTAQPDAINLAQALHDGDRVYVPGLDDPSPVPAGVTPAQPPSSGAPGGPAGPIDLNTATVEQLDALPGVGPSTAAAIVAYRDANGPFASVDDLDEVRGIGPTKLAALRDLVTT